MLTWLSDELQATPAQERLIVKELDALFEQFGGARDAWRQSREDIAQALRGESFDEEVMGESFGRQDDKIREVREALVGALARIHDALDEPQRARLAQLLESGPRGGGPGWGRRRPGRGGW